MRNIVFIGMPGAGKTTISKELSKQLNLPVIDIDEYLVEHTHMKISDMFSISEKFFRKQETKACKALEDLEGHIISCGGGVVLNPDNMTSLMKNGDIYFLDRSVENIISNIDLDSRPLLDDGMEHLYELYDNRIDLYRQYATYIIDNNATVDDGITRIMEVIKKGEK